MWSTRLATSLAGGVVIGVIQWRIVRSGMRAASSARGLAGVGRGAESAAALSAVTFLFLAALALLLRLRVWGLAALSGALAELLLVLFLWPFAGRLGLDGDSAAMLCIVGAVAVAVGLGLRWPRHV